MVLQCDFSEVVSIITMSHDEKKTGNSHPKICFSDLKEKHFLTGGGITLSQTHANCLETKAKVRGYVVMIHQQIRKIKKKTKAGGM